MPKWRRFRLVLTGVSIVFILDSTWSFNGIWRFSRPSYWITNYALVPTVRDRACLDFGQHWTLLYRIGNRCSDMCNHRQWGARSTSKRWNPEIVVLPATSSSFLTERSSFLKRVNRRKLLVFVSKNPLNRSNNLLNVPLLINGRQLNVPSCCCVNKRGRVKRQKKKEKRTKTKQKRKENGSLAWRYSWQEESEEKKKK